MTREVYVGRIHNTALQALICVLTGGLYFFVWWTLINSDLRRHRGRGGHPVVLLLLFLLVPVVGWFLALFLSGVQVRHVQRDADADKYSSPIYPALWGLVPVVGWAIAAAILQAGANRAWEALHTELDQASHRPLELECPQCSGRFNITFNPLQPQSVICPECGRHGAV